MFVELNIAMFFGFHVVARVAGILCCGLICVNPTIQGRFAVAYGCTVPETTGKQKSKSYDRN